MHAYTGSFYTCQHSQLPGLRLRLAVSADITELKPLSELAVRVLAAQDYSPQQIDSVVHYIGGVDPQLIADGTYYVATLDQQIVGCGGWSWRRGLYNGASEQRSDDAPVLDPAKDAARIRSFFVHPQWARRGIGRCLLHVCERAAQQWGFTRLELLASLTGVPLYTSYGFSSAGRSGLRLPDGVLLPVVRMHKSLPMVVSHTDECSVATSAI